MSIVKHISDYVKQLSPGHIAIIQQFPGFEKDPVNKVQSTALLFKRDPDLVCQFLAHINKRITIHDQVTRTLSGTVNDDILSVILSYSMPAFCASKTEKKQ